VFVSAKMCFWYAVYLVKMCKFEKMCKIPLVKVEKMCYISAPTFQKYVNEHLLEHAVRFSKRGYRKDGYITNMPMYLVRRMNDLL